MTKTLKISHKTKQTLADRMKHYEKTNTTNLDTAKYLIVRIDGKSFHTWTKNLEKPFDHQFINQMNQTTQYLCENIQGCVKGYVQSDEISLIIEKGDKENSQTWMGGKPQKITSISAAMASAKLTELSGRIAVFDSRVFSVPSKIETLNYLLWRQQDATRNSVLSLAYSHFSVKEVENKKIPQLKNLLETKNIHWENLPEGLKYGRQCTQVTQPKTVTYLDKRTKEEKTIEVDRQEWHILDAPQYLNMVRKEQNPNMGH